MKIKKQLSTLLVGCGVLPFAFSEFSGIHIDANNSVVINSSHISNYDSLSLVTEPFSGISYIQLRQSELITFNWQANPEVEVFWQDVRLGRFDEISDSISFTLWEADCDDVGSVEGFSHRQNQYHFFQRCDNHKFRLNGKRIVVSLSKNILDEKYSLSRLLRKELQNLEKSVIPPMRTGFYGTNVFEEWLSSWFQESARRSGNANQYQDALSALSEPVQVNVNYIAIPCEPSSPANAFQMLLEMIETDEKLHSFLAQQLVGHDFVNLKNFRKRFWLASTETVKTEQLMEYLKQKEPNIDFEYLLQDYLEHFVNDGLFKKVEKKKKSKGARPDETLSHSTISLPSGANEVGEADLSPLDPEEADWIGALLEQMGGQEILHQYIMFFLAEYERLSFEEFADAVCGKVCPHSKYGQHRGVDPRKLLLFIRRFENLEKVIRNEVDRRRGRRSPSLSPQSLEEESDSSDPGQKGEKPEEGVWPNRRNMPPRFQRKNKDN